MPIHNQTRKTIIANNIVVAKSPAARMQGLLGRDALPQGDALVITACQSVHMFFMRFAIDVIFVDGKSQVIGLCENLQPFQLSPIFFKAHDAIEVPAGIIKKTQTQLGDQLSVLP